MNNKIAVIMYGPQGAGKGTQAELLANKFNLYHFDTGDFLRKLLYDSKNKNNKEIRKERKINESGNLNTPRFVLNAVKKRTQELAKLGQSLVYSGSPRTWFEAFGDDKNKGLFTVLEKIYNRKNIYIFILKISEKESIKRTISRFMCSVCGTPLMAFYKSARFCPFCGGKIKQRKDDNLASIIERLKEYRERTQPIFKEFKKRKFKVIELGGAPAPYKIHQKILSYLK